LYIFKRFSSKFDHNTGNSGVLANTTFNAAEFVNRSLGSCFGLVARLENAQPTPPPDETNIKTRENLRQHPVQLRLTVRVLFVSVECFP